MHNANAISTPRPWWRYGMVWLVISGPLIVVVAGIWTAVIAFRGADPVVTSSTVVRATGQRQPIALQPAMVGRNHAATGQAPGALPAARQAADR
jgi:hypothetical protein